MQCINTISQNCVAPISRQRGLALITVLFIFAVTSLLAMGMQNRQKMDIAQAASTFANGQAQLIAISAEDFIKAALVFDYNMDGDKKMDTSSGLWNMPFKTTMAGDMAEVEILIRDLQGLFNLNSLAKENPNRVKAKDRLARLLNKHTQVNGSTVAQNVMDWMDAQSMASYQYQAFDPPYSAGGVPFTHPSELRLIEGMTEQAYDDVKSFITALPFDTALNVNTTTVDILSSWQDGVTTYAKMLEKAEVKECGKEAGFEEVKEFWDQQELQDIVNPKNKGSDPNAKANDNWSQDDFSVNSQYFSALISVKIDEQVTVLESIIKRDFDNPKGKFMGVVYRDFSKSPIDFGGYKLVGCQAKI